MIFSITETLRIQRAFLILCYFIVAHLSSQQYCTVQKYHHLWYGAGYHKEMISLNLTTID